MCAGWLATPSFFLERLKIKKKVKTMKKDVNKFTAKIFRKILCTGTSL